MLIPFALISVEYLDAVFLSIMKRTGDAFSENPRIFCMLIPSVILVRFVHIVSSDRAHYKNIAPFENKLRKK